MTTPSAMTTAAVGLEAQPVRLDSTWLRATLGAMVLLIAALTGLLVATSFGTVSTLSAGQIDSTTVAATGTGPGMAIPISVSR